ncbi:MAG TPA: zinc-ribbon domain-containing protein [Longimicrobium sp.]|jgi:type II secretory pathway pseudopilin PulG
MAYACPECGAPVSERAAVCPQCGFPIRRDAIPLQGPGSGPGAPPPSASGATVLIIALVAGGIFMVMAIGVLAAIAIPRFSQAARRAKEIEGEHLLKQAYDLEQTYRAENGRYTSRIDDLRWDARPTPRYFALRVSAADRYTLCVEAVPTPAAGGQVTAMSVDEGRTFYHQPGCGGPLELSGADESSPAPGTGDPAAEREDGADAARGVGGADAAESARELLRQVYAAMLSYRARHGRAPTDVAGVLEQARDFRPGTQYQLDSARRDGQVCFIAVPRAGGSSLTAYSLDPQGRMFEGSDCAGTLVGRFSSGRP